MKNDKPTEGSTVTTFYISEIAGDGEEFPIPSAEILMTVEAENGADALNAYEASESAKEGVDSQGLDTYNWTDSGTIVSADNADIMAYTREAIS